MKRTLLTLSASACFAFAASAGADVTFSAIDTNTDGYVTEAEYITHATASGDVSSTEALVEFIAIDADASGTISQLEMTAAMDAEDDDGGDASTSDDDVME